MNSDLIGWLRHHWWGLLVAYAVAVGLSYTAIWAVIEPLDVPAKFESLWSMLSNRSTYHVAATLFLSAHGVLLLELFVRKSQWWHGGAQSKTPPFDRGYEVKDSKKFYDAISSQYDQRNSASLLRTHEQVIRSIKQAVEGRTNVRLLDLGGGTGKLVAHHFFDSTAIHWIYVDESALMVEQFRKNLEGTKLKRTVEVEEIARYLQRKPNQEFDVIVISLVLTSMEYSPDWTAVAARLSKTGRLIVAEIDAAYTAIYPYYIVKVDNLRHALLPRAVPLTQLVHETKAAGLKLDHSYPISEGRSHYAFVAEFIKN